MIASLLASAPLDPEAFARFTEETWADLARFGPESVLALGTAAVVLGSAVLGREASRRLGWVALGVVLAALWLVTQRSGAPAGLAFSGMLRLDPMADFFGAVFLAGTAAGICLAMLSRDLAERPMGEAHASFLCGALGMMLMAEAADLVMLFVAVETLSLPSYVLAGWKKRDRRSSEAALKYVLYGSVAAGIMLYGISLLYGLAGSTKLAALAQHARAPGADGIALAVASLLALAGLGFKMASVPFHFWAPDVYEGAPTPVAAWLSVGSKAAGVAAFIRFAAAIGLGGAHALEVRPGVPLDWTLLAALLSGATMTLGNLGALHQTSLKRLLAYSSIAHVGYILVGVAALGGRGAEGGDGLEAAAFYVVAYAVMNLGAFACVVLGEDALGSDGIGAWRGLGARAPRLALAMTVFLVALIGIPPTVGFSGKFQLFLAGLRHGLAWLVVLAALNAAVSAYFYLRVVKAMLLDEPEEDADRGPISLPLPGEALVAALATATLALGLFFDRLVGWAREMGPLR